MAAVTYLFGFGSYGVEHTYGGEKVIACYMHAFQMRLILTINPVLNFAEFRTTLPLQKNLI